MADDKSGKGKGTYYAESDSGSDSDSEQEQEQEFMEISECAVASMVEDLRFLKRSLQVSNEAMCSAMSDMVLFHDHASRLNDEFNNHHFYQSLYRCFSLADDKNTYQLEMVFPVHAAIFRLYNRDQYKFVAFVNRTRLQLLFAQYNAGETIAF